MPPCVHCLRGPAGGGDFGVETEGHLAFLRGLGCAEYQGFYFSKPLPAPDFGELLERSRSAAAAP